MNSGSRQWTNPENKARIRRALLHRDGPWCWICGGMIDVMLPALAPGALSIDHKIRRREGGGNRLSNLALAHRACNGDRG